MSSSDALRKEFLDLFRITRKGDHRYTIFSDFVTTSAIAIHNAVCFDQKREDEYLRIVKPYDKDDLQNFCRMLSLLTKWLDESPRDILGELYMSLDLSSDDSAQFFTPSEVSDLMARLLHGDSIKNIDKPFVTLSDPACGAGSMVLSFVKQMISAGHNPAEKLYVHCIDVDRVAAMMCYIQLSLWGVPATIVVGNTLTLDTKEVWHTPIYYLNHWESRLQTRELLEGVNQIMDLINGDPVPPIESEPSSDEKVAAVGSDGSEETQQSKVSSKEDQLGFDFFL